MWRRAALSLLLAFIGYLIFGFLAGLFFVMFIFESRGGGSGNGREIAGWFAAGGLVGAIVGIAAGFRLTRRRDVGAPTESDAA